LTSEHLFDKIHHRESEGELMGNYSKMLTKRLRKTHARNDNIWTESQSLGFQKRIFEEWFAREEWRRRQASHGITKQEADTHYDRYCKMEHWTNDDYWVVLDKECRGERYKTLLGHPLWHLTITRRDEQPDRNWQMFQIIKNEIVGQEYEAVELYPAQSRLMDVANKYHLWVLAPKEANENPPHFPIGMKKHGPVNLNTLIISERTIQRIREFTEEERKKLAKSFEDQNVLIFPEALHDEVEKEFSEMEYGQGIREYVAKHEHELELQPLDIGALHFGGH
jgi:hypothetical protein